MSKPEVLLWQRLKPSKSGLAIRREVPLLGRFIVDFYFADLKVAFEIDGKYHLEQFESDSRRDDTLAKEGVKVVRIPAQRVLANLSETVDYIRSICLGNIDLDSL